MDAHLANENMMLRSYLQQSQESYWSLVEILRQKEGIPLRQEIEKRLYKPTSGAAFDAEAQGSPDPRCC